MADSVSSTGSYSCKSIRIVDLNKQARVVCHPTPFLMNGETVVHVQNLVETR